MQDRNEHEAGALTFEIAADIGCKRFEDGTEMTTKKGEMREQGPNSGTTIPRGASTSFGQREDDLLLTERLARRWNLWKST